MGRRPILFSTKLARHLYSRLPARLIFYKFRRVKHTSHIMTFSPRSGIRITLTVTFLSLASILAVAALTTPDRLGPFGITLWFGGFLLALGGFLTLILYQLRKGFSRGDRAVVFSRALRHGILTSTWISSLVALNSLRQLGLKDIVLVTLLVVLIEFYMRRLSPS